MDMVKEVRHLIQCNKLPRNHEDFVDRNTIDELIFDIPTNDITERMRNKLRKELDE